MAVLLVTSRSFGSGERDLEAELAAAGHEVLRGDPAHRTEELREALSWADAWIAGTSPVTAGHLDLAPRLRVLARYGVGVEAVDLTAAAARGVVVTSTPGANSAAVADHTIGLALAALRGIAAGDRRVRAGDWSTVRGRELGSLRVGIIGLGRIGRGVAARLSGFGAAVLGADPFMADADLRAAGVLPCLAAEIPARCDLVTLHAPGGRRIVDADWLACITRPLVLVNTARADLVDEEALAGALRSGRVAAYAADTLAGDVAASSHSPLLAPDLADRVTLTPHLGAQTREAVDAMGVIAVRNALAVLAGEVPPDPVALPRAPRTGTAPSTGRTTTTTTSGSGT